MKIALCLSGQPRNVRAGYETIYPTLIKNYDVDVFVHSWIEENQVFRTIGTERWTTNMQQKDIDTTILDLYKPKKWLFEKPKKFIHTELDFTDTVNFKYLSHFNSPEGVEFLRNMEYSMWYSIFMCNIQKEIYRLENNVHYDYVVKCRFDLNVSDTLRYESLNPNILHSFCDNGGAPEDHIRDWALIGSNEIMNVVSNVWPFIKILANNLPSTHYANEFYLTKLVNMFNVSYTHIRMSNGIIR